MEVAKRVKSKALYSSPRPSVGVKVLKRKPGKVSLPVASKTKLIKKQIKSKVATSTEQNAKPKKKKIVKKIKDTNTENEGENQARDTEAENKLEDAQTKAKKPKGLATAKKTKEETNTAAGTSKNAVPKKKPKAVKVQKTEETDKKNKIIEEVYEAITKHGEPRKGASSQAIKNYIFSKRGIENEDASHKRINKLINNTLRKAVENGDLARPASSKGNPLMPSATGRFVLAKKASKPKIPKKPKLEEDGEVTE